MNTAAELGVLAIPVGLLMIGGEFDLSVGSVIGASSILVASTAGYFNWPMWASIAAAVLFGAIVGVSNGIITVSTRLPSFIVTIAGMFIVAGLSLGFSRLIVGTTSARRQRGGQRGGTIWFAVEWLQRIHLLVDRGDRNRGLDPFEHGDR